MQDLAALAVLMWQVSFGIFLFGLFYTFGMFALSHVFSVIGEAGGEHEVDHDIDHDIDHDVDHDIDHGIDHDVDHGIDHDVDHDVSHDVDHGVDQETETDQDVGVEHDVEHGGESGFFETSGGAPMGVTIGTSLVTFGFFGSVLYYEGLALPLPLKALLHISTTVLIVYSIRALLSKVLVESGFMIQPRHIVGRQVEAVSTVKDDFGEIRAETEMGLRRFLARPFVKGGLFQKGTTLYVVSADEKFVYVDPRKDIARSQQKQSGRAGPDEKK